MGGRFKVLSNNGYVLELEPIEGGKSITVNLNQFSHGGQINEKNMKKLGYAHIEVVVAFPAANFFWFFGHNSAPRQFWEAPLGGNESYRPPGPF